MTELIEKLHQVPIWDNQKDWVSPPPLQGNVKCDVCVVGLGGSGLVAVNELAKQGYSVFGIDALDVGAGAAGRNGGFFVAGTADFYHDSVAKIGRSQALELYQQTLLELDTQFAQMPTCTRRTGSLRIAADDEEVADCQLQFNAMKADNLPVNWYKGPEGQGLFFPRDGVFQPMERVRLMARQAQQLGAVLHSKTRAIKIEKNQVTADNGQISCQLVIVAVDGKLELLLPELKSRVRTCRLQMIATAPAKDVYIPYPVYRRFGYDYWQQLADGCIALGGFRDQEKEKEWTFDDRTSETIQKRLEAHLRNYIKTQAPITHRWAASVSYTESGKPICEEVKRGVFVIGAYSGTGNIQGVVLARKAVEWAI